MLPSYLCHLKNAVRFSSFPAWVLVGVVVLACLAAGSVSAQTTHDGVLPSGRDLDMLSIESLLDVKVMTASKKAETLSESPAAVYVVDRTDIYRYGYRTLADALGSIVGLYISSDREFDRLGVRGYSRAGDFNGRVLVLIDGHKVSDPVYGTGTIGEDCPVDIEDVERIEVVKGPGSALWGTNAVLAIINVITRTARDVSGGRVTTDGQKLHAEYGDASGSGVNVVASATGLRRDGQRRIYFPEFDSPETNNGVAENADATNSTHARLALSHNGFRFAFARGVRTKVLPTAPYGTIFNDNGTMSTDSRQQMELSYERQATGASGHALFARVFSDEYDYLGYYIYDSPLPRTVSVQAIPARWWGGEIRMSNTLSNALSVLYGAEYMRTGLVVQSSYDLEPYYEYYAIPAQDTVRSLYAQANFAASDVMHFTLGTRYDRSSGFGGNWSPRAALVYSPSRRTTFKALYGTAFRAPNFYELGWTFSDTPKLHPEKIQTQELVWEQRLNSNSRLVASLFRFEISDIIAFERDDNGSFMANDGSAESGGFEIQYENRSSYGTRGYAGLCVSRTTGTDHVSNSPNFVLTCGVSMPVLSRKFYVSPQVHTVGRVFTVDGNRIGPRTDMDLVITTATESKGTSVSLGVYNLLGTISYAPGPSGRVQDTIPQPDRTVLLTVSRSL